MRTMLWALTLSMIAAGCGDDDVAGPDGGGRADAGTYDAAGMDVVVPPRDAGERADSALPPPDPTCTPSASPTTSAPVYRDAHPRILLDAPTRARLEAALAASEPAAMRFRATVDAQVGGGDVYGFEAWYAALLGQLTGDARYCTWAVSDVDAFVASEETEIAAGRRPTVAADSYLDVGPRVGDVMLVYDFCFDDVSAAQRTHWTAFAAQAVWNVWHAGEARWGATMFPWSGWSVNNPSNNYYYSFLRATMLFGLAAHGEHPDAAGWLDFFRTTKIGGELVPTFERDLEGGGSREGTGYGVAMMWLYTIYDFWRASTGEDLSRLTTHAQWSLVNMMQQTVPTLDRVAPTGDHSRDSTAALFDYHRHYAQVLAHLFDANELAPVAKTWLDECSVPEMSQQFMRVWDFLYARPGAPRAPLSRLHRVYHGPGTGQLYARSSWDRDATWLGVVAGPYTESHAHHDQGSFLVYRRTWLAYDANVDSHSGIEQAEAMHNVVELDGKTMREGHASTLLALRERPGALLVSVDAAPVYADADVRTVVRQLVWVQPDVFVIMDHVAMGTAAAVTFHLSSPVAPLLSGGQATWSSGASQMTLRTVLPAGAGATVTAWPTLGDFSGGARLDVTPAGGPTADVTFLHVLDLDGAVVSATAVAPGALGADVVLTTGETVRVTFAADGGATVVRDATGPTPTTIDLPAGVDSLAVCDG